MDIELRSEKTRKLIGQIPPRLVRCGTLIITVIVSALLAAAYFVPCPQKIEAEVIVTNSDSVFALVPFEYVDEIGVGMTATIEFEGYSANRFGYTEAVITEIDKGIINQDNINFFKVRLNIVSKPFQTDLQTGQKGSASILIANESLISRIFK